MKGPLVIGICGRSCSGKGEVCEAIANVNREVLYLNSDVFFKSQTPCKFTKHNRNGDGECWECSKCIWFDRLINCIKAIKNSKRTVVKDRSAWTQHCDVEISVKDIGEKRLLIVEGFLLFSQRKLTNLFDHRVFIDVSDENILSRRLKRQNGQGKDYIQNVIIPVSKLFEDEQKDNADFIIDGNGDREQVINSVWEHINKELAEKINFPLGLSLSRLPWMPYLGDLLMDHLWHPIDYDNLKSWVKGYESELESGKEIKGEHFRYRKNLSNGNYEIRLSHRYHMYRYVSI